MVKRHPQLPDTQTNKQDLVKLQDLPLWKSIVVITETFALMLGGPLSSLFTDQFGWRS